MACPRYIVDSPDEKKQPTSRSATPRVVIRRYISAGQRPPWGRRQTSAPATSSPRSRARRPDHDITAVCRASSSCSRRASGSGRHQRDRRHGATAQSERQRKILITLDDANAESRSSIPRVHVNVQEGERVRAGDPLMDGENPHDICVPGEKEPQIGHEIRGLPAPGREHQRQAHRVITRQDGGGSASRTSATPSSSTSTIASASEENERAIAAGGRPATRSRCCSASPRRRSPPSRSFRPRSRRAPRASSPRRSWKIDYARPG